MQILNFNFYIDVYYVDVMKLECRLCGWGDLGSIGQTAGDRTREMKNGCYWKKVSNRRRTGAMRRGQGLMRAKRV